MVPIATTYIRVLPDWTEFRRQVAAQQKVMVPGAAAASAARAAAGRGSVRAGAAGGIGAAIAGTRGWDVPAGGGRFYVGGRAVQRYPRFVIGGPEFGLPDPLISTARRIPRARGIGSPFYPSIARKQQNIEQLFNLAPYLTGGSKTTAYEVLGLVGKSTEHPSEGGRLGGWRRRGAALNPMAMARELLRARPKGVRMAWADINPEIRARLMDPSTGKAYVPKGVTEAADQLIRDGKWWEALTAKFGPGLKRAAHEITSLGLIIRRIPVIGWPLYAGARLGGVAAKWGGPVFGAVAGAGVIGALAVGLGGYGAYRYGQGQLALAERYRSQVTARQLPGPLEQFGGTQLEAMKMLTARIEEARAATNPAVEEARKAQVEKQRRIQQRMQTATGILVPEAVTATGAAVGKAASVLGRGIAWPFRQLAEGITRALTTPEERKKLVGEVQKARKLAEEGKAPLDPYQKGMEKAIKARPDLFDPNYKMGSVAASGLGSSGVRGGVSYAGPGERSQLEIMLEVLKISNRILADMEKSKGREIEELPGADAARRAGEAKFWAGVLE